MKIRIKLLIVAIIPIVVILATLVSTLQVTSQQKSDGLVINIAGRQRMLSQKITKEMMAYQYLIQQNQPADKIKGGLKKTMKLFQISLEALRSGGPVPITLDIQGKSSTLPPARGEAEKHLTAVAKTWKTFRSEFEQLQLKPIDVQRLDQLLADSMTLLGESNKAVVSMQKSSEKRVQTLKIIQLAGLIVMILSGLTTLFISRSIVKGVDRVNRQIEVFSQGKVAFKQTVPQKANELDSAVSMLNMLGEKLCDMLGEIDVSSETLRETAGELKTDSEETNAGVLDSRQRTTTIASAIEQMSVNIANVSEETEHMSSAVSTVASAIEEMTSSLSEVAQNTEMATEIANTAEEKVKNSVEIMGRLNTLSSEIGRVLSTINDIADQTNLLALNATIEAASAGEAGKGFAVVANEVKELAKQTANATLEISRQVEVIQQSTGHSVKATEEVSNIIDEMHGITTTIALAVEEQTSAINEIARNVLDTSSNAEAINTNMGETLQGVQEISREIQNIDTVNVDLQEKAANTSDRTVTLAGLSEELHNQINKFDRSNSTVS